ncbi:signal transduction histidine kinase [Nocardioides thalensis]|uniref:Signal transduction histidine kinase n=1 Tax=Nocardioides thalensis TaxID=1914755 RepID=A0A853C3W9_9ACTN|nr:ATP-binding protein [Nocardioides thalensis]NYJ02415.1 signal transduction histidine kinase [Nocardioides thalensis]
MPLSDHSTHAAALRLLSYFVAAVRVGTLVQMAPSLGAAFAETERPALTAVTWVVAATMLLTVAAAALVRRRPTGTRVALLDVGVALALLVAGSWTVPEADRMGTWVGFQLGYALCVSFGLIGVQARWVWLLLLAALAVAEAAYLAPTVEGWADLAAVAGNVLTIAVLGPLSWFGARLITRIASDADEARRLAAAAAQAEEERRARLAIHNGTAVMRLMVESGVGDRHGLRTQAEAELNRMRAYLTGAPAPTTDPTTLAALVTAAGAEFDDLPITVVADLAQDTVLPRELADDLAAALRSLLLNVRQHSGAGRVVLHAEEQEDPPGWEVSLHDDGSGFETTRTPYGVGLREVVVEQLARSGVTTTIDSVPGVGTTVTLVGQES